VYELIVRRFLATCAEPATWERLRVVALANDEATAIAERADGLAALRNPEEASGPGDLVADGGLRLKANGKRLLEAGYHDVYPYRSSDERIVPDVEVGETLALTDRRTDAKETQPPRRYGQSRLIEEMEKRGVGTKATRHRTLEKLYDRNYIESDPPRPTRLAEAVVEAAEEFAEHVVSEEMTAQLERDMQAIAAGEKGYDEVTEASRELLNRVFDDLTESREAVGDHLQKSLKADKTLGPCPECGSDLLVRKSRQGSYFVGCDGYPDCEYTLPLPSSGKPLLLDETCEEHELRHVKMLAGRKTFVHGCPQCKADEADEQEDEVIGACPECGEEHGGELAIKRLRSGSRLVGCTRYPDCDYSLPLPGAVRSRSPTKSARSTAFRTSGSLRRRAVGARLSHLQLPGVHRPAGGLGAPDRRRDRREDRREAERRRRRRRRRPQVDRSGRVGGRRRRRGRGHGPRLAGEGGLSSRPRGNSLGIYNP